MTEEDSSGEDYQIYGTVYDAQGAITDSFDFKTDVSFVTDQLEISNDGSRLCSNRYIYNMADHTLISLEELLPEGSSSNYLKSVLTKDGVLSVCWDSGRNDGRLYLWMNGEACGTSAVWEEEVELASSDLNYRAAERFEDMVAGKNGLVILKGSDGERQEEGYLTTYYLVYSAEDDSWKKIDDQSEEKGLPWVTVAENKKWFASAGKDHKIRIYDFDQEEVVREWNMKADLQTICDMKFVLDDRYLVIMTYSGKVSYQIIRVEDGAAVYSYSLENNSANPGGLGDGSRYFPIKIHEAENSNRIYLMNEWYRSSGVCIDTKSWESIYEVPSLRCVLNNQTCIISDGFKELLQIPCLSLEKLIEMGNAALIDGKENG